MSVLHSSLESLISGTLILASHAPGGACWEGSLGEGSQVYEPTVGFAVTKIGPFQKNKKDA